MAALSRRNPDDPRLAERFELYVCGLELANAFGELTDPAEQRARFLADQAKKRALYGETYPIDEDFLAALEHGLPAWAGIALGFDRLVMLAPARTTSKTCCGRRFPNRGPVQGIDPSLDEPGEITIVLFLDLGLTPVKAGDRASAALASAPALHFIVFVSIHGVIESQLLVGLDIPESHVHHLTLQPQILVHRNGSDASSRLHAGVCSSDR